MTGSRISELSVPPGEVVQRERGSAPPTSTLSAPASVRASGWTPGRITALVVGAVLFLGSIGLLGAGAAALWLDQAWRDGTGYVTTGVHDYSTAGSALVTESVEHDSPGIDWFYSTLILGNVRIRVTPADSDATMFVGIGPTDRVQDYVAGMRHTILSDPWRERVRDVPGGTPSSPPGGQDFWVASATGSGAQTLTWDAANGLWTAIVMKADGRPGVDVVADFGATFPALSAIGAGLLVLGVLFAAIAASMVAAAIRRQRVARTGRV